MALLPTSRELSMARMGEFFVPSRAMVADPVYGSVCVPACKIPARQWLRGNHAMGKSRDPNYTSADQNGRGSEYGIGVLHGIKLENAHHRQVAQGRGVDIFKRVSNGESNDEQCKGGETDQ